MPLISVIVPVYNAEKTLRQCVDSVLGQNIRDFELLLIDDGSRDASPAICDEYAAADCRVTVIHQQNSGVSAARNAGLDRAKGEWVLFIDSDDYIDNHFFEGVEGAKENLLIRGFKVQNMAGEFYPDNSGILDNMDPQPPLCDFIDRYFGSPLLRGPVLKFYRRNLIGDQRFVEDMKVGEDSEFVWRYLARAKSYRAYYYYYYYYITDGLPSEVKYRSTTAYAIQSLRHLLPAFQELSHAHSLRPRRFLEFMAYFKLVSKDDWSKDPTLWYSNPDIKRMYAYVWPDLPLMSKLRLTVARLLKR